MIVPLAAFANVTAPAPFVPAAAVSAAAEIETASPTRATNSAPVPKPGPSGSSNPHTYGRPGSLFTKATSTSEPSGTMVSIPATPGRIRTRGRSGIPSDVSTGCRLSRFASRVTTRYSVTPRNLRNGSSASTTARIAAMSRDSRSVPRVPQIVVRSPVSGVSTCSTSAASSAPTVTPGRMVAIVSDAIFATPRDMSTGSTSVAFAGSVAAARRPSRVCPASSTYQPFGASCSRTTAALSAGRVNPGPALTVDVSEKISPTSEAASLMTFETFVPASFA